MNTEQREAFDMVLQEVERRMRWEAPANYEYMTAAEEAAEREAWKQHKREIIHYLDGLEYGPEWTPHEIEEDKAQIREAADERFEKERRREP